MEVEELMAKLKFNPDSELAKRIRRHVELSGRFPKVVDIDGFKVECKVYGGKRSIPVKLGDREVKSVWIDDVIFRYLPYSMTRHEGKRYVVREVVVGRDSEGRMRCSEVVIEDFDHTSLLSEDVKRRPIHSTTSDVRVEMEPRGRGPYSTFIIKYDPLAVNYIGRGEREVFDPEEGRFIKLPYYYVIERFPVPRDVREALREESTDFTRGFMVELKVPRDVVEGVAQVISAEGLEGLINASYAAIDECVHLALHAIVNMMVEVERWNYRDVDHFVDVRVDIDEEVRARLRELLGLGEGDRVRAIADVLAPKLSVRAIVGSKVDLVKGFNWDELEVDRLEGLEGRDLEAELALPRCFTRPTLIRGSPRANKLIASLARALVEGFKDASSKVKAY